MQDFMSEGTHFLDEEFKITIRWGDSHLKATEIWLWDKLNEVIPVKSAPDYKAKLMTNNTRKMGKSVNIRICFTQNVQDTEFSDNFIIITPYIRMLDSDWLMAVIFFYKFRPCIVNLQNFYFM